jgi:hypothetical protein
MSALSRHSTKSNVTRIVEGDEPMLYRDFYETQSLPERQICRPWMCAETLCSTTYYDSDCAPLTGPKNIRARLLRDGAYAKRQKDVPVDWYAEI